MSSKLKIYLLTSSLVTKTYESDAVKRLDARNDKLTQCIDQLYNLTDSGGELNKSIDDAFFAKADRVYNTGVSRDNE